MLKAPPLADRGIRWLGIPLFGIAMAGFGRLFALQPPTSRAFWWGLALFIGLAALLWHGQRFVLLKQHEHSDWFAQPAQRLLLLAIGLVFGAVPLTLLALSLWYRLLGLPAIDGNATRAVVLFNLAVVVFVTHAYETWFFGRARGAAQLDAQLADERRLRLRAEAEREALENQLEPTLLVNALSAIGWLITRDPPRALELSGALGRVYRYILTSRGRDLVLLSEEMAFIKDYTSLLAVRFEDAVVVDVSIDEGALNHRLLPPVVLQLLVESALKNNVFSRQQPLRFDLQVRRDEVVLSNLRQPLAVGFAAGATPSEASPGEANLRAVAERFRLATASEIDVTTLPDRLSVRLPLLSA
ncbi:MAG TPA: histidine kinase [Polyangia bacterium]